MNQSYGLQFRPEMKSNSGIYEWTRHARSKMAEYGLAEGRLKRVIRFPKRTEEGIAPGTFAVMQPAGTKNIRR